MNPTLEELVDLVSKNQSLKSILSNYPNTYAHLSEEDQETLRVALEADEAEDTGDIGVDARITKFGAEPGDQGSWPNTPFTG